MASPFTEVNFRPPFPLRAAHVFIQFVRYFTRRASILQYNLFDISLANHPSCVNSTTNFAEFKPLNLPKLNKKFTNAKRKSRQKPPPNAHFCTVFGTSKISPSVPKTPRNPARRTTPQTPPDRPTPRRVTSRHPARGGPKLHARHPTIPTPDTPSQPPRRPAPPDTPDQTLEPSLREVWNPGPAGPGATLRAALRAMPHRSARRSARRAK